MELKERQNRVVGRGSDSNHAHIITGNALIERNGKTIKITCLDENVTIKHLLESEWLKGKEVWTQEHKDIKWDKGIYEIEQQVEYNPLDESVRAVQD